MAGHRKIERTVPVNFRLTEAEKIVFDRLMAEEGYRSKSLFIRDRLFHIKPGSRKSIAPADPDPSCSSSPELISHIRKIGVNINTACRNINSTLARLSPDSPFPKSTDYWLKKISSYLYRISTLVQDNNQQV